MKNKVMSLLQTLLSLESLRFISSL